MKLKYAITLLLFSCLGLSALTAQSNLKDKLQLRNFFKDDDMPVHYLDEILSSSTEVKAICIQKEDLIPTYYGELCLLDSILNYQKDSFSHKVQSVERLYLETYLPENLVQLLAQSASVKTIMIKPLKKSYPKREIQKLSLLKKFEQLNYIEIADTSLAFIECIQQLENLDTVVWLNKYIPTLYLDRLTQINTLIIHHHQDAYNYRSWEIPPSFKSDFPTQLKTL